MTLIRISLALLMVSAPAWAQEADIAGSWIIEAKFDDGSIARPLCIFQQAGARLTGTCKGPNSMGTSTGAVKGQQVSFTWNGVAYTPQGGTGQLVYSGALKADGTISGKVVFNPSSTQALSGTFIAMKR